jgi:hypothetical protein
MYSGYDIDLNELHRAVNCNDKLCCGAAKAKVPTRKNILTGYNQKAYVPVVSFWM